MDKKRVKTGGGGDDEAAQPHHPWDEVSLPGAGAGATEQPTILQVLNQVNTTEEYNRCPIDDKDTRLNHNNNNAQVAHDVIEAAVEKELEKETDEALRTTTNNLSDNLVSSFSKADPAKQETTSDSNIVNTSTSNIQESAQHIEIDHDEGEEEEQEQEAKKEEKKEEEPTIASNVLEFESHLIETYEDSQHKEESVGINELPPIKDELTEGTSKIESEDSKARTVIEVEPAGAKLLKPVETLLQPQDPKATAEVNHITEQETKVNEANEVKVPDICEDLENVEEVKAALKETQKSSEESHKLEENDAVEQTTEAEKTETLEEANISPVAPNNKEPAEICAKDNCEVNDIVAQKTDDFERVKILQQETTEISEDCKERKVSDSEELKLPEQPLEFTQNKEPVEIPAKDNFEVNKEVKILQETPEIITDFKERRVSASEELKLLKQPLELTAEIRQAADKLVQEIEEQVLETLRQELQTRENSLKQDVSIEKTSTENSLPDVETKLTQQVDEQLSEVTSILKKATVSVNASGVDGESIEVEIDKETAIKEQHVKIVNQNGLPAPNTPLEQEQRQSFIDSLPQLQEEADGNKLIADCKREYYQSLRKYLVQHNPDKPPVPLQTYRWEDLKRAKERGGYPWTHLYKRPLGPHEEPELVLLLRKSQELRFQSESPKSLKKVRYDEQVLVKETERYIQELSEEEEDEEAAQQHESEKDESLGQQESKNEEAAESHSLRSECISCVSDSVLAVGKPRKSNRLSKIRGILKRRRSGRTTEDAQSLPGTSVANSRHHSAENLTSQEPRVEQINGEAEPVLLHPPPTKTPRCFPIMKKLRSMADRQKKRLNIKKITLKKDEKIVLGEETKILKLKSSPKSERGEIPHFIEKQDSDDVLEIIQLDESPSRKRKDDGRVDEDDDDVELHTTSVVIPDEIIDICNDLKAENENDAQTPEPTVSEILEEEIKLFNAAKTSDPTEPPPKKTPRLRREHVYEEIDQGDTVDEQINEILEIASVEALKQSLSKQDDSIMKSLKEAANKPMPLDRMGSSEEDQLAAVVDEKPSAGQHLLAPISSIDSTSSDEDRARVAQLSPVAEESDVASVAEGQLEAAELRPSLKKEASPAPSDKKVTFSHVEDEAEPHREDIELSEAVKEAAAANRWKNMSDHEYEPIGEPTEEVKSSIQKEPSPAPQVQRSESKLSMTIDVEETRDEMKEAEEFQKNLEEHFISSASTTPRTESRTDYEVHSSQVEPTFLEDDKMEDDELPVQPENRKKSFMASVQDKSQKMQAGIKSQAGKIKTKLRTPVKKTPSGSPKAKERKRFKAPEFSKIKMPVIKGPDMSKLKDFKRPEFTKFNKPDMSKFKLPEFSTLKLKRSKSFKENETSPDFDEMSDIAPESTTTTEATAPPKKKFEFNFGTYPRAFRKKKKPVEPEPSFETGTGTGTGTEGPSIIPSTETQPSIESSSSPQGDRGPGPVRSRWADKFSDVSYNDSEGSRSRRYGSEQESFDRESSLERRMREDLDDAPSEENNLGILGGGAENKQFAEFDEENRAIHEISNLRAGEFKRRPMVHQDSDLVSEESKDAVGWTDKEIQKNKLLRQAELEAEASYLNYTSEDAITQETRSTASSDKKMVMEEIDDDEFFLRKRGISEDNMELRQYISTAIREGFDMPINALQHVGQTSNEPLDYGDYDVPPPKPRRLHKSYRPEDVSQEFETHRSEYDDDLSMSQNGSDFFPAPKRPMRKGRSRSKYSIDSQEAPMVEQHYFDDDEDYLRPPPRDYSSSNKENDALGMNDLNFGEKQVYPAEDLEVNAVPEQRPPPAAPTRRRRQTRDSSTDKDSYMNGFGGRSVSNSYLQPPEDVIVYRTEHEYHMPLATTENYADGLSAASHKSRSFSRYDEDDRTSRGADSLAVDQLLRQEMETEANTDEVHEKYIIDMMENDGYAIVRKEQLPKPTPPARRKKFSRSPGERFATMPNMRTKRSSPAPPERPPPPRDYSSAEPIPPRRKSALSLDERQNIEDDYDELDILDHERPESPRNLQSGDIINKMKYRPLPPPPRPPREKRQRVAAGGKGLDDESTTHVAADDDESNIDECDGGAERLADTSTADSYDQNGDFEADDARFVEVEVSTQTDPLPDDYVCEEFEITDDMRVIEPRRTLAKTLEDMLLAEQQAMEREHPTLTEDEQLARGLQRFRDANQRSLSERSRASSQADRSKSQSRPQTPSAVVIERRVSTPVPSRESNETMLEAALIVRPIDDLDLEEAELRREGLLTDSSQQSKSDVEYEAEEEEDTKPTSDYSHGPSSIELEEAIESLRSQVESERETEEDEEVERTMQESLYDRDLSEGTPQRTMHYDGDEEYEKKTSSSLEEVTEEASREITPAPPMEEEVDFQPKELKEEIREDPVKYDYERKLAHEVLKEEIREDPIKYDYERKLAHELLKESTEELRADELHVEEAPQAPPRRRSTSGLELPALTLAQPAVSSTIIDEPATPTTEPPHVAHVIAPLQSAAIEPTTLPSQHMVVADLEVERLRVHALQAGQIMVSQLHGTQISSDDLECKSGNLVVNSIALPAGFIEDIVERVRHTDRHEVHAVETQTSLQASKEALEHDDSTPPRSPVPPPKPPRQRDLEAVAQRQRYLEEDTSNQSTQTLETPTMTTASATAAPPSPPPFPTVEYLQSLAPLAFYNIRNLEHDAAQHRRHRRRQRRSRDSTPSEEYDDDNDDDYVEDVADAATAAVDDAEHTVERRRHRSRSTTRPRSQPQSVVQAGRQFLSACSLSLVQIINQLTNSVRGGQAEDKNLDAATRARHVPTLVVLFILITFGILLFLLSGKSVHHHHWDYFNPPGNDGRIA